MIKEIPHSADITMTMTYDCEKHLFEPNYLYIG